MNQKTCINCKVVKPLSDFYKACKGALKTQTYCKICQNERTKKWRNNNKQHVNAWAKTASKKEKYRFKTAIRASKRRGYEWHISENDYLQLIKLPCYYCNNHLSVPAASGLDRLNNEKHYTIDNVVTCCALCNKIKNTFLSPEETKAAVDAILKLRKIS